MTRSRTLLTATAIFAATVGTASAQPPNDNSDEQDYDCSLQPEFCKCSCVRGQCTPACLQPASPEIIAALRKRFPDLEDEDEVGVFDNGKHQYDIAFFTKKSHMSCRLQLKPIRFKSCHPVHV